ncbi:MAG TPA: cysteine desulfurase [Treponema sp.]|nr:cysteine desulfurase [Treponema sp.]
MKVYLDWAASAPPDEGILKEALAISRNYYGNPSSVHHLGLSSAKILEDARKRCAEVLGVSPATLYFTSGGTEANHIPLLSILNRPGTGTIALSAIEHPSIIEQAQLLKKLGWKIQTIPVTPEGFVTVDAVLNTLTDDTSFVAVMAVNNETGAIQPVADIAEALSTHGEGKRKPYFHVDFVQAAGKVPIYPSIPGIDSASFSAHKLTGPRGIGLLYLEKQIEPFLRGGGQEAQIRPGTENIAGAVALSRCLEKFAKLPKPQFDCVTFLNTVPGISIIPYTRQPQDARFSPWIIQCTNDHLPGEVLVRTLSETGVYISTGSACSSRKKNRPVLSAMGISDKISKNAFRISFGPETSAEEMNFFIDNLKKTLSLF